MVISRYAELVEPGKFALRSEELTHTADQLLVRITACGMCQYDGVYYKGIVGQTPTRIGHEPVGIRLDSGDLAYLSIEAAEMLDAAGFEDVDIVLSGNLDELEIWQIRAQILDEYARAGRDPSRVMNRLAYGVGTRLITSQGHEALDGVYKLVAIEDGGRMTPTTKVSDTPEKQPVPGEKELWRIYDRRGSATADVIATGAESLSAGLTLHHPHRHGLSRTLAATG